MFLVGHVSPNISKATFGRSMSFFLQDADTKLENNTRVLDVLDSYKVSNFLELLGPTVRLINLITLFALFAHALVHLQAP